MRSVEEKVSGVPDTFFSSRTYNKRPFLDETPLESLMRDIEDVHGIYCQDGLLTQAVENALAEIRRQNEQVAKYKSAFV